MKVQAYEALRAALVVVAGCNADGAYDREEALIRLALREEEREQPTITQADLDLGAEAFEGLYRRIAEIIKATPEDADDYNYSNAVRVTTGAFYSLPLARQFGFLAAAAKFLAFLSDVGEPELPMSRSGAEYLVGAHPLTHAAAIYGLAEICRASAEERAVEERAAELQRLRDCAVGLQSLIAITRSAGIDPNGLVFKQGG